MHSFGPSLAALRRATNFIQVMMIASHLPFPGKNLIMSWVRSSDTWMRMRCSKDRLFVPFVFCSSRAAVMFTAPPGRSLFALIACALHIVSPEVSSVLAHRGLQHLTTSNQWTVTSTYPAVDFSYDIMIHNVNVYSSYYDVQCRGSLHVHLCDSCSVRQCKFHKISFIQFCHTCPCNVCFRLWSLKRHTTSHKYDRILSFLTWGTAFHVTMIHCCKGVHPVEICSGRNRLKSPSA